MRMSNSGLARAVANYADETDPFGEATLDSPAEVFYQRGETITISCKTTKRSLPNAITSRVVYSWAIGATIVWWIPVVLD